jgi:hypothetical protein
MYTFQGGHMFRRHRLAGLLVPLAVGGLLYAFGKHAHHHRAHMMAHCADAKIGGDAPFDRRQGHGHWRSAWASKWQHMRHMHHWGCPEGSEPSAEQTPADTDAGHATE